MPTPRSIQRTYLTLLLGNTLATSFIWGINTIFLLGTVTLTGSTFLYVFLWQIEAPLWEWAIASMLLGLGFTFSFGAVAARPPAGCPRPQAAWTRACSIAWA